MLKLSNRGLYGIKALYELAKHYDKQPLPMREISTRHGMPAPFLEQVLYLLKQKGLVKSIRGTNGGYLLSRPPDEITIGDVVRAIEGPIALCDCLKHKTEGMISDKELNCFVSGMYRKIGEKIEQAFDSVTLLELTEDETETAFTGTCKITVQDKT